ncbi:hypothetical protein ACNTMW_31985 [Planosporangium sp. 12N6]|uniref:hypothetical protein n=1 Tax=Planosporangium spinosum TaxID=3402278 RepID=UPI003CEF2B05
MNSPAHPDISAPRHRRRWHPLTVAFGLAGAACVVAGAAGVSGAGASLLGTWLVAGAAAGFATSGST